jgi:hypothetical protein
MESLEDAFEHERALVVGIGGGGDVVGTVPTARLLESHGVDTILGGVAWERWVVDPTVGPRPFAQVTNIDRLNDAVALASADTRTDDGVAFAESRVAAHYDTRVALLDISGGPEGLRAGLDAACESLDADLVVGVDSGGDALAAGDEPGLRSPLADAVALAALSDLETEAALGVFGYGSDGELTAAELQAGIGRAAQRGGLLGAWGLTRRAVEDLERLLESVETEASRLPVAAARGEFESVAIREGEREVPLSPTSTVTFYLDPATVAGTSDPVECVRGTDSLGAADVALDDAGYRTELERERDLAEQRGMER